MDHLGGNQEQECLKDKTSKTLSNITHCILVIHYYSDICTFSIINRGRVVDKKGTQKKISHNPSVCVCDVTASLHERG